MQLSASQDAQCYAEENEIPEPDSPALRTSRAVPCQQLSMAQGGSSVARSLFLRVSRSEAKIREPCGD